MKKAKYYCEFGKVILKRLAELNMTQKALAVKTNSQACQISCYVRGIHKPNPVILMKICMELGLDISEMAVLLEEDELCNE